MDGKVDWGAVGLASGIGAAVGAVSSAVSYGITSGIKAHISKNSIPKYPGDDGTKCPGKGYEWRGNGDPSTGKGSWYNPKTGESMHPDLGHGEPIGPHWDYTSPSGETYRIFPNGTYSLK